MAKTFDHRFSEIHRLWHNQIQIGMKGFTPEMATTWQEHAKKNEKLNCQIWEDDNSPFSKSRIKRTFFDIIVLYVSCEELTPAGNTLLLLKRKFPSSHLVVMSNGCDSVNMKSMIVMGADGFVLTSDKWNKIESQLIKMVQKNIPAISENLLPLLMSVVRGPSIHSQGQFFLSDFQRAVANLLVQGMSYNEIAVSLDKNIDTIRYHIKQIYQKLNITKRMQLMPLMQNA